MTSAPMAPYWILGNALTQLNSAFTYWQTNSLARTVSILRTNLPANQPLIDAIAAVAAGPANELAREIAAFQTDARTQAWGSTPLGGTRYTPASVLTAVPFAAGEVPGKSFYFNAADDPSIALLHPVYQGATVISGGPDNVRGTADDVLSFLSGYPLKTFYRTASGTVIWSGGGANPVPVTRMDAVVGNCDLLFQTTVVAGNPSLVARVAALKAHAQAVQAALLALKPQIDALGAYAFSDPPPSWLTTYYPGGTFFQFYTGA